MRSVRTLLEEVPNVGWSHHLKEFAAFVLIFLLLFLLLAFSLALLPLE
jgi:hypothetical protein